MKSKMSGDIDDCNQNAPTNDSGYIFGIVSNCVFDIVWNQQNYSVGHNSWNPVLMNCAMRQSQVSDDSLVKCQNQKALAQLAWNQKIIPVLIYWCHTLTHKTI